MFNKRRFFSQIEKDSLVFVVNKYQKILENKDPQASYSNHFKKVIWKKVTEEFNAMPGVTGCTVKQAQDLYKNMKRRNQCALDRDKEKVFLLTFGNSLPETITTSETEFLTDTDPGVGMVLKPQSPEDSKEFLKTLGEERVNAFGLGESSNKVQSNSGCIAIDSITSLAEAEEPSTAASYTLSKSTDSIAHTSTNDLPQSNEMPSVPQTKPSASSFRTKYLTLCRMKKKIDAAKTSAKPPKTTHTYNINRTHTTKFDLDKQKLEAEIEAQLNAERRAQERHDLEMRNFRRVQRKMIRDEKRAKRDTLRAEKLHALKVRCLEAKIRYFESQMGVE